MKECCEAKGEELAPLAEGQRRVLWTVLVVNLVMFFVEFSAGILSRSSALSADALDMLGDSTVYAFSLYALYRSDKWKAWASLLKGGIMLAFGGVVFWQVAERVSAGSVPEVSTMGIVGALALAANLFCAYLLFRYRHFDLNMRSTWLCSRNDVIANGGVLIGALAVELTGSLWPDALIGVAIAALFLRSAVTVTFSSVKALRGSSEFC